MPGAERARVPDERCFTGFDAYQKVIAAGIDLVILATPGVFRPGHLRAALEFARFDCRRRVACRSLLVGHDRALFRAREFQRAAPGERNVHLRAAAQQADRFQPLRGDRERRAAGAAPRIGEHHRAARRANRELRRPRDVAADRHLAVRHVDRHCCFAVQVAGNDHFFCHKT